MHLITFIHHTDDWSDLWIKKVFVVELILLVASYPLCLLCIYLLFFTKQYHPNLGILMKHVFVQYPFQMAARIALIVKMFLESEEVLRDDPVFTIACCVRSYLIFIAFYFSIFAMIERVFATVYLKDYESNQRKAIGYTLTILMHTVSYISATFFVFEVISVWPILISFVFTNVLSFVICHITALLNQKKFEECESSSATSSYNLSERYQLAENLAVITLFKKGIVLFIFFSLLCCSFMTAEEMDDDVYLRNWLHVSFNISAALYGIFTPLFLLHYNEEWRIGVKRLWARFRHNEVGPERFDRSPSQTGDPVADARLATERYFSQLAKDWGADPRCPQV